MVAMTSAKTDDFARNTQRIDNEQTVVLDSSLHDSTSGVIEGESDGPGSEREQLLQAVADLQQQVDTFQHIAPIGSETTDGKSTEEPSPVGAPDETRDPGHDRDRPFRKMNAFLDRLKASGLLDAVDLYEANRIADNIKVFAKKLVEAEVLTRWQAAQLVAGRGMFFLGNYKLLGLLCRTEKGSVFVGEHVTMNRHAAIKMLSKRLSRENGTHERFLAAVRTVGKLEHPNIARAYSCDTVDGRLYLVMEYVDGSNLEKIVGKDGALSFELAADYIRQAAEGLHYVHSHDIVHHRLHPSHLMVNKEGVVKIIGLGKGRDQKDLLDSVDYIAFEQALATDDLDHRADIYSLGCIFYHLLTDQTPLAPQSIGRFRPDVPEELVEICEKMMAKRAKNRYQSAEEVAQELERFLEERLKRPMQSTEAPGQHGGIRVPVPTCLSPL